MKHRRSYQLPSRTLRVIGWCGQRHAQGRGRTPDVGPQISDDDSSSGEDRDRPSMAPSARTISIARNWLAKIRQTDAPHSTTQVRNENVSRQNERANPYTCAS